MITGSLGHFDQSVLRAPLSLKKIYYTLFIEPHLLIVVESFQSKLTSYNVKILYIFQHLHVLFKHISSCAKQLFLHDVQFEIHINRQE